MKMNLDMSFEEGMDVVNALRECAINNGWNQDELDECGVMEEYTAAVDAALTAMGISVSIAPAPEVEDADDENEEVDNFGVPTDYWSEFDEDEEDDDEEDDEEEDNNGRVVYSLTAKGEFVLRYMEAGHPFEEACAVADLLFGQGE